jgi:hypothetical protein
MADTKFKKGVSGNPSGRPKQDPEIQALARELSTETIHKLAYWMRSDEAKASIAASAIILDRAWGKARQAIDLSAKIDSITVNVVESKRGNGRT